MTLGAAWPLWAAGEVEVRRPLAGDGRVGVEMISGSIRVLGWDKHEVQITGRLRFPDEQLEIDGTEDHLSIEIAPTEGRTSAEDESIEIRMPRGARLEIETVSASIDASDLSGDVALSSISGDIRLKGDLRSVGIESVSGTITLEDGGDLHEGRFETVSGEIRARANFRPRGDFDFETVSGTILLTVPAGLAADFEVQTFSGRIDSDFGTEDLRRLDPPLPSRELTFSTGSGGARVSVHSFSGLVRIRKE
jgi:DUF4097 and DUF4098 domain-containing protein YvlB